ncbi:hypothetical protein [Pacificoceanicola onchidii]|uniref:hypothetical protein n=1 Tax=Pacificoceanicola onchidii TaxID=2562685 RepID=UPI0010A35912|nr:hypothetical protein [Pacificoceanicola onchidii]
MSETTSENPFSDAERRTLLSLAEMFQDKKERDLLRDIVRDGTTLREILLAYRTQRRLIAFLKAFGGLIVLAGAAVAALKGLNLWPK